MRKFVITFLVLLWPQFVFAIFWPVEPINQPHALGNYWGEYQNYSWDPYLHPGIDIFGNPGDSVFAVRPGFVKAVLTTSGEWHWRVAIGDTDGPDSCNGWLYAHLEQSSIAVNEGDYVAQGQYLGRLVEWPIYNFHHLHFACIRGGGWTWTSDWLFVGNPYDSLDVFNDTAPPVFYNAYNSYRFAISDNNNTSYYFNPGGSIQGTVDVIAKIDDLVGSDYWRVNPHKIEYTVHNDMLSFGPILSFKFSDRLYWEDNIDVIYRDDAVCNTRGDYDYRDFYFIVTNTDGDGVVESDDAPCGLKTTDFPDGNYWFVVTASDGVGNTTADSMTIDMENNPTSPTLIYMIAETIPIIIPSDGGSFRYTGILRNNTNYAQNKDVWIMLNLPDGSPYGPLEIYHNVALNPGQTISQQNIVQNVPAYAPAGEYSYIAYTGNYPYTVLDSAVIHFEKSVGTSQGAGDWQLTEWIHSEGVSDGYADGSILPESNTLSANYPNPFNNSTVIRYNNVESPSNLRIYDISGRLILSTPIRGSGEFIWRGADNDGIVVPTGIYFYRISGKTVSKTFRMTLLK